MSPEIVSFTKSGGPLTKKISLDGNGRLISDGSACVMARGVAHRKAVGNVEQLGALISSLKNSQAFALGMLRPGLPNPVDVAAKHLLNGGAANNCIARTGDYIIFKRGARGFVLVDYDAKGMPNKVSERLREAGGFWLALTSVLPLDGIARVARASTSSGLYRCDTGEKLPGSNGVHIYVAVKDCTDSARFLKALHERCWLDGFGWFMVGAGGQLLERSIVDRMVGSPERLVFEGAPVLVPPLAQDATARRPDVAEGDWLDTLAACPPLTVVENAWLAELRSKAAFALAGDCARAREDFIAKQAADALAQRRGLSRHAARQAVIKQCNGILLPSIALSFDDDALAGKTVADVHADPGAFEGETLADPLEGFEYGRCKAMVMRRADGTPWIHSFAHGRVVYEIKLDAEAVRAALQAAACHEVVATLVQLILQAEIDDAEEAQLIADASRLAGVGKRVIIRSLKQARAAQAAEKKRRERERRLAERNDPRPMLPAPEPDAPWLPEMDAYNSVLGASQDRVPPARNIDDQASRVRKIIIPAIHAFADANEGGDSTKQAPAQWVIKAQSECEVGEMLERHIDFIDWQGRSVHCPAPFVRHYMSRGDGALPLIVAISTLPLVMANGDLLAADGLDRARGIVFNVDSEIMKLVPNRQPFHRRPVGEAMLFLRDEWLVDVATDHAGKSILIALALTVVERSLLDQRPAFFITAGKRGNGKTTTLKMILEAITGVPAAASAWSPNDEERRKALLAYFMYGVPYILWDNIARGSQIACPHIEKSCTSAFYVDRKLGVSELVATAASTIHVFTGNNIAPRGDLASRSLQVRLDANRIDPENREFKHPDPLGWTQKRRCEILQAIYTILLGNPALDQPRDAAMKTRYKLWYRLVGSAVEHAAQCAAEIDPDFDHVPDQVLDLSGLFLGQEAEEEDAADLAEMLDELNEKYGGRQSPGFKASEVSELINTQAATNTAIILRSFLFPTLPHNVPVTSKAVGKRLKAHVDEPVKHGQKTLVLKFVMDTHNKVNTFRVDAI